MILIRNDRDENGTYGELRVSGEWLWTVERPWKDNEPFVSCVPAGYYDVYPHDSPRFGPCFILENLNLGVGKYEGEAERWGILIHPANVPSQLQGCIAPGLGTRDLFIDNRMQRGVSDSRAAMRKLHLLLGRENRRALRIVEDYRDELETVR